MKRIWHRYDKWEDYLCGMWRKVPDSEYNFWFKHSKEFTSNADLYGKWMLKVLDSWPVACEHNLTDVAQNRQAWIGHAACCLAFRAPEYIVRDAWWTLTDEQRESANKKADFAIARFEGRYARKNKGVDFEMGAQGLFRWDS